MSGVYNFVLSTVEAATSIVYMTAWARKFPDLPDAKQNAKIAHFCLERVASDVPVYHPHLTRVAVTAREVLNTLCEESGGGYPHELLETFAKECEYKIDRKFYTPERLEAIRKISARWACQDRIDKEFGPSLWGYTGWVDADDTVLAIERSLKKWLQKSRRSQTSSEVSYFTLEPLPKVY